MSLLASPLLSTSLPLPPPHCNSSSPPPPPPPPPTPPTSTSNTSPSAQAAVDGERIEHDWSNINRLSGVGLSTSTTLTMPSLRTQEPTAGYIGTAPSPRPQEPARSEVIPRSLENLGVTTPSTSTSWSHLRPRPATAPIPPSQPEALSNSEQLPIPLPAIGPDPSARSGGKRLSAPPSASPLSHTMREMVTPPLRHLPSTWRMKASLRPPRMPMPQSYWTSTVGVAHGPTAFGPSLGLSARLASSWGITGYLSPSCGPLRSSPG